MRAVARRPPVLGRMILRLARLGHRRAECESDLGELFATRLAARGSAYARRRYLRDAVSLLWRPPARSTRPVVTSSVRAPSRHLWSLDPMVNDIRFALRLFRRQAGVMTLAVVGLALAIGVNTAAFSFVDAFALRPSGVSDPDAVVQVGRAFGPNGVNDDWPYGEYLQLRDRGRLFTAEAYVSASAVLAPADALPTPVPVRLRFVSGGFFNTVGGKAVVGRVLRPTDDAPAASPVVVLSYAYWASRFGAEARVVGSTVPINGTPVTIVGVAERAFTGPFADPPAAWSPLRTGEVVFPYLGSFHAASAVPVSVIARLAGTQPQARAEAEASAVMTGITPVAPGAGRSRPTGVRLHVTSANRLRQSADFLSISALLMGIVGLVLLLACTNVANLLLAGATTRRQEIAARLALGASRGRIVRQLVTESVLIGLAAGVLGLLAAAWAVPALARLIQAPPGVDVSPDLRVFAFAALTSVVAGVAAGLAPARYGIRGDLLTPLKGTGEPMGAASNSGRLRATFVGIQAAASVVLLVLAALFGRSVLRVATSDVGLNPSQFISGWPDARRDDPQGAESLAFLARAIERARSLPGVAAAAVATQAPFESMIMPVQASHDGRTATVHEVRTSAEYFETLGLRVVQGRLYTEDEVRQRAPVAVISSALARSLWGPEAIGGIVDDSGRPPWQGMPNLSQIRIVGVVEDAVQNWRHADVGMVYLPLGPGDIGRLILRTNGEAFVRARPIEEAIGAVDPTHHVTWALAADDVERQLSPARNAATLTGVLGVLALGLAVVGIFGVTAFVATQRRREIGIRLALGATRRDILALLLGQGLRPVVMGLAVGVMIALGLGQVFAFLLYGVSPRDPLAIAGAVVLLAAAAGAAVLIPARRASRADPARVLRQS